MKTKLTLILLAMVTMCMTVNAQKNGASAPDASKVLIAYFSATGTTAGVANKIANVTGGKLYRILPETDYSRADLNWNDKQSRSSVEMNDPKVRPTLKDKNVNAADYDVVFLGYPIWWDKAPRIINTFIEAYDWKGKRIIPFATSGGSSIRNSVKELKENYPDLTWEEGRLLNRADESSIRKWTAQFGF